MTENARPDALLPCPFCGKEDGVSCQRDILHFVSCAECGCHGPHYSTGSRQAIAAWNRRAAPADVAQQKEQECLRVATQPSDERISQMGTKNAPAKFDCYSNALPDEPMFILLARDPSAPDLVEGWASGRIYAIATGKKPQSDMAMVEEAQDCAKAMRAWRQQNNGRWREAKPSSAEPKP